MKILINLNGFIKNFFEVNFQMGGLTLVVSDKKAVDSLPKTLIFIYFQPDGVNLGYFKVA